MNLFTPLSCKNRTARHHHVHFVWSFFVATFLLISMFPAKQVRAEGSKDFVNYAGYRMFLDTRDTQQFKVYAGAGEFINVGASHVGISGGYIAVYRPDGQLHTIFDNTGATTNMAIIYNSVQEINGPTGVNQNDAGYVPGVIEVLPGEEGVWTVVFDFPTYSSASFNNILNNAAWTRAISQPTAPRVVLAWDITVSQGAPGNAGGTLLTGRVYTNEYITLINSNGFTTSPRFYVLTREGYLYRIYINDADPFRFPISSNSRGLVDGLTKEPIYQSRAENTFIRSAADPSTWIDSIYLYEPQAKDIGNLVNNKIFFNPPDTTMPATATVTDVFRSETYTTWLNPTLLIGDVNEVEIDGIGCSTNLLEFGQGAYLIFDVNISGRAIVRLDVDGNGSYDDAVDVLLQGELEAPTDTLFWDGKDGLGNSLPPGFYTLPTSVLFRYGEIHIALTDVENNLGGLTFKWINAPAGQNDSLWYYDHTFIGGPASGGGTPGNPLPTQAPYTYSANFGNNKYLDQWSFIETSFDTTLTVEVVENCVCLFETPAVNVLTPMVEACAGETVVFMATNDSVGFTDSLTYTWSGPNGFSLVQILGPTDTSVVTLPNATVAQSGNYTVILATPAGCADTAEVSLTVNPTPIVEVLAGAGSFCEGDSTTIVAINTATGISTLLYVLTGPDGNVVTDGGIGATDTLRISLGPLTVSQAGDYVLEFSTALGCSSEPDTIGIDVLPTPALQAVSGGGDVCTGADVTLSAINTNAEVGTIICTWTGPNGFFMQQTAAGTDTVSVSLTSVTSTQAGTYTLICVSSICVSPQLTFELSVNETPVISNITPDTTVCEGTDLLLSAENSASGTGPITYTWTGPNGFVFTDTAAEAGPFPLLLSDISVSQAGTYTLVLETAGGCQSDPASVEVTVLPAPLPCNIQGSLSYCVGQTLLLQAENCGSATDSVMYTWTGPNGFVFSAVGTSTFTLEIDNVQLSHAGTYCLELQSLSSGCAGAQTACVDVEIELGLILVDVTPDSTYCEGEEVILTATNQLNIQGEIVYTWTGPNGFFFTDTIPSNGMMTVVIPQITVLHAGTYILTAASLDGCVATPATVLVDVVPGVVDLTLSGGGNYCENTPVELTAVAQSAGDSLIYVWTYNGATVLQIDSLPAGEPSVLNLGANPPSGIYTVTVSTPTGECADSLSTQVGSVQLPMIVEHNQDTILCPSEDLLLFGRNGVPDIDFDYTWVTANGTIISGSASGTEPFTELLSPVGNFGSGTYTLILSNQACPDTISFEVTLKEEPDIEVITSGTSFCMGASGTVVISNNNFNLDSLIYVCTYPDGTVVVDTIPATDTVTVSITSAGTFCCEVFTLDGCSSGLFCTSFNIIPVPVLEVVDSISLCEGDTLYLTGSSNTAIADSVKYIWTGPDTFYFEGMAPASGPFDAVDFSPQTGQYCLTVELMQAGIVCAADEVCIDVTVNPMPVIDGIFGGGVYCDNEPKSLSAVVFIADNSTLDYEWTLNDSTIATGTAASGDTLFIDPSQGGTYCLTVTSEAGCSTTECTTVGILVSPTILEVTGAGTYCEGDTLFLSGTGTPGLGTVFYTWIGPNFQFDGTAPSEGPFDAVLPGLSVFDSGKYVLVVFTDLGCASEEASVEVDVNPMPLVTGTIGDGFYCENDLVSFGFIVDPNGGEPVTFTVTGPAIDTTGTINTATTLIFQVNITPNTQGTYILTLESAEGCRTDSAFVAIALKAIDMASISASSTLLCMGDPLQLTTNEQVGQNVVYEWYLNGQLIATTTEPFLDIPDPVGGNYSVLAVADGCSSLSDEIMVEVVGVPDAADDSFQGQLNQDVTGNVLGNDSPSAGNAVTIEVLTQPQGGMVTIDADGNMIFTPDQNFVGSTQFQYEICQVDCPELCDQATVTIEIIQEECIVPNIITPNGDGINDVVQILCLPQFPNNSFKVFNRWGDEIFVAEPYNNDWDGTWGNDRKELPAGTYYYIFKPDRNKPDQIVGFIRIAR